MDPWFHRIVKALWRGGFVGAVARSDAEACDADAVARLWHRVIEEAAGLGQCVAVGRGGQCLLQGRPEAFHVHIYAPMSERMERLKIARAGGHRPGCRGRWNATAAAPRISATTSSRTGRIRTCTT